MKYLKTLIMNFVFLLSLFTSNNIIAQNQNSEMDTETIGPQNGSLMIVGGGRMSVELWDKFKELMGGADKQLVVIPTAQSSNDYDEEFLTNFKNSFINRGFNNVTVLHTRSQEEANSKEFTDILRSASGVWFSGGRQWRLADSYLNTKTHDAFNDLLNRDGVIGGSSAGATIQGSYLARGDSKTNTIMMGDHEEGLAFIKNTAIDQHVLARNRQNDMFEILDNKPELLGIGIDESTAIIVKKNKFTVMGESYVAIYDGTRWSQERDTIYTLAPGSREYYWLKPGDEYNLKTRSIINYKNREFITLDESDLRIYCGEYQRMASDGIVELFLENGSLFSKINGGTYMLQPESKTRFYVQNSEVYLEFVLDSKGKVKNILIPARNQILAKLN